MTSSKREEANPMHLAGLPISTLPIGLRERVIDSSDTTLTKRSPVLRTRRSVSSMKGLLPLALSSSCSSLRSQLTQAEEIGHRVHENLPELLAQDLELSKAIFEARSMTAGVPFVSTSPDLTTRYKTSMLPYRVSSPSPSRYRAASARVLSLGAIEEQSSIVSFVDEQDAFRTDDAASDSDSLPVSGISFDAEPPSFRRRHQSLVTNATSLASTNWRPSSKSSSVPSPIGLESRRESSWIEADSEAEDEEDDAAGEYDMGCQLSPRPATPAESDLNLDIKLNHGNVGILHRKAHSMTGGAPLTAPRRQQFGEVMIDRWQSPVPQSTTLQQLDVEKPGEIDNCTVSHSFNSDALPNITEPRQFPLHTGNFRHIRCMDSNLSSRKAAASIDDCSDLNEESDDDLLSPIYSPMPRKRPNSVYIRPSPPASPLPSVQAWLGGNAPPFVLPFQNDELARLVPLPPDVMETLRVSTSCFPETMLLSSSLTVETIRSYSKKVRNPSLDVSLITPPPSPTLSKRSLWRRVVKLGAPSIDKSRDSRSSLVSNLRSPSSSSLEPPRPWLSIKNVFGSCSDYICDALYAHIIAYNYISALVARDPAPSSIGGVRCSNDFPCEDIPKKAASLLGLSPPPSISSVASSRAAKRLSSSLPPWVKDEMSQNDHSTSTINQAAAFRSIQADLLRCIQRLIATARLMAESGSEVERLLNMDAEDQDILFMRSLCEIVRIAEEAANI